MKNDINIEIYRDDNPEAARTIRLYLSDGILSMEEQDVGPLVEKCFGDSDYERFLYDISAKAVNRILGTTSEDELIDRLKNMFGVNSGYDDFTNFLSDNNINTNPIYNILWKTYCKKLLR